MKRKETSRNHLREIREFEAEQSRAALAEKLLKSEKVEDPFWNISPHAPLVQRVGVCIVGFFFLLIGGIILRLGLADRNWFAIVISLGFVLAGGHSVRNGFRRPQKIVQGSNSKVADEKAGTGKRGRRRGQRGRSP